MFIFLTLGLVVLAHLFQIGLAMMGLAAIAGVLLYVTRPRAASEPVAVTLPTPGAAQPDATEPRAARMAVPRQHGERNPAQPEAPAQTPARAAAQAAAQPVSGSGR